MCVALCPDTKNPDATRLSILVFPNSDNILFEFLILANQPFVENKAQICEKGKSILQLPIIILRHKNRLKMIKN